VREPDPDREHALTTLAAVPAPWRVAADIAVVTLVPAVALLLGFPHRTDYAGHFLAGAGGTAGLLAMLLAFLGGRPWLVVITTMAAVMLGVVTEATVFRLAIFDPVDLAVQSLGAVIVGCAVVAVPRSLLTGMFLAALGAVLLMVGFWLAFA
jgi:hypothetical protein